MNTQKENVAIVLTGGISKKGSVYSYIYDTNRPFCEAEDISAYVNFKATYLGLKKNVIDVNPEYNFDIFVYSWNTNLKDEICSVFNPHKSLFENNEKYKTYILSLGGYSNCASHALSMKKGIELVESTQKQYKFLLWDRPDTLLWKPLMLNTCDLNKIYTLNWNDAQSDVCFLMNMENASKFKYLVDSAEDGNTPKTHFWIKNYIENYMNKKLYELDIYIGQHWEVTRKLYLTSFPTFISESELLEYELTLEEIKSYL